MSVRHLGIIGALRIGESALVAQRVREDVISSNIANADTTRNATGTGPYQREQVVFETDGAGPGPVGVRVQRILQDQTPAHLEYNPTHPDADAEGYVHKPNVDVVTEYTDMLESQRSYGFVANAISTTKSMAMRAIELLKVG